MIILLVAKQTVCSLVPPPLPTQLSPSVGVWNLDLQTLAGWRKLSPAHSCADEAGSNTVLAGQEKDTVPENWHESFQ